MKNSLYIEGDVYIKDILDTRSFRSDGIHLKISGKLIQGVDPINIPLRVNYVDLENLPRISEITEYHRPRPFITKFQKQ